MADVGSQPTVIQSIYGWYREGKIHVNRRYQRKLVWTLEEKQKLIESILKKYPIPAILLAEKPDSNSQFEVIDGLQRLHAIVSFIENAFPTIDGRYFDVSQFTTSKSYADAGAFEVPVGVEMTSQKEVSTLLDYTLALSIMRNATPDEVNDVFDRINTYGHRLSDQERRQAGVENQFSRFVRELACDLRGDVSADILPLYDMPSISIDLPKTRHGYSVQADSVFWVNQGILRSTDLRDSMDEQCIADIAACICRGSIIERSKEALDNIYTHKSDDSEQTISAVDVYGVSRLRDEILYCIQEIQKVCAAEGNSKLRDIVYDKKSTNPFPSVFAVMLIAFHEIIFVKKKIIADYKGVRSGLTGIFNRLETSRKATAPSERKRNINTIVGMIEEYFIEDEDTVKHVYSNHTTVDIEGTIRRSEVELPAYELKQGLLRLDGKANIDDGLLKRVSETICAIANNGPNSVGKVMIGVTDSIQDAARVREIDGIEGAVVGSRRVVGVKREAKRLKIEVEKYFQIWKDSIRDSGMSEPLRGSVLSSMDYNDYFGLGVIIITIPQQKELSFVGEDVFYRQGDSTLKAEGAKAIAEMAKRF